MPRQETIQEVDGASDSTGHVDVVITKQCDSGDLPNRVDVVIPQDHGLLNNTSVDSTSPDVFPDCCDHSGDHSGEMDPMREYTGVFEGPEKTLEVMFRKIHTGEVGQPHGQLGPMPTTDAKEGLRRLGRHDLDRICARARCTILSQLSNKYLDAYVLSESSLFVYPYMVVLKTCGTTTLLRCIAILIEVGKKVDLEVDWVGYSRKNFNFPGDQAFPHQSFHQELEYLYSHKNLSDRLDGNGYTLGPVTSDHWFVYVADQTIRSTGDIDTDRVINIMMFDIDDTIAETFYYQAYDTREGESKEDETVRISKEMTCRAGIDVLCPGAAIDSRAFEPCGYSMNAILFRSYSTMHITPEAGSSYASFETNARVSSYRALINNVVRTFKPKRFVITLMADEGGLREMKCNPLEDCTKITVPRMSEGGKVRHDMIYKRSTYAGIKVEEDINCMMGNWVLQESVGVVHRDRGNSVA
eukprot:CAMPEP_0195287658 /NCGR_PEP_ID=MMETSP0707-20130614/4629_1 /TAXON_ID=33640 /ORGANISM="Asterionellopsis glacialis, Strain CCMP134" /LENGTH=468 /DNA_ID=CAMNT_0040347435 /DNA_START=179 /DNA_END=1585 /DNA_ORIENTATION=+